jgi:hypothetical protein
MALALYCRCNRFPRIVADASSSARCKRSQVCKRREDRGGDLRRDRGGALTIHTVRLIELEADDIVRADDVHVRDERREADGHVEHIKLRKHKREQKARVEDDPPGPHEGRAPERELRGRGAQSEQTESVAQVIDADSEVDPCGYQQCRSQGDAWVRCAASRGRP